MARKGVFVLEIEVFNPLFTPYVYASVLRNHCRLSRSWGIQCWRAITLKAWWVVGMDTTGSFSTAC